jgi:hypothetical protein
MNKKPGELFFALILFHIPTLNSECRVNEASHIHAS